MKLWKSHGAASDRDERNLRHEFVIGPLHYSGLSSNKARLYYCTKCKWLFLVSNSKVAVLDQDGSPLIGDDSLARFKTFEEGPCPVLEAFAVASSLKPIPPLGAPFRNKSPEPGHSIPPHAFGWPRHPRPVLRVLGRV